MNIGKYLSDKPDRAVCHGLQLNDLASLAAGVKSVVYTTTRGREESRLLDELCSDLKLNKVILEENREVNSAVMTDVLIGTSPGKLAASKKAYQSVRSRKYGVSFDWGVSLDYPECCVKSYVSWHTDNSHKDLIRHIYDLSPAGTTFPFWMNNVFNYYSRLNRRAYRAAYASFSNLNQGMDRESIIPWHPCSYLCEASVKKGWRVYEVFKRHMPLTAAARKVMLSKPVVFWDNFIFAILNGSCRKTPDGFAAAYKGLSAPRSLLSRKTEEALSGPGNLQITPAGKILNSAKLRIPKDHIFIPFSL